MSKLYDKIIAPPSKTFILVRALSGIDPRTLLKEQFEVVWKANHAAEVMGIQVPSDLARELVKTISQERNCLGVRQTNLLHSKSYENV